MSTSKNSSNTKKLISLFLLALLVVVLFGVSYLLSTRRVDPSRSDAAAACTIYVSPQGKDENSGSQSSPTTLDSANKKAVPGSVICLTDGTHYLKRPFYITKSGTSSAWIVYRAQNKHRATVKWNDPEGDDMFQMTKGSPGTHYIEVSDLVFDGSYNNVNTAKNAIHGHVGTHHLKVMNNIMRNLKGSGIGMGESDYNWVIGNRIHHVGNYTSDREDGWGSGITLNSSVWLDRYSGIHTYIIGNIISGVVDGSSNNSDGNGIIMDKALSSGDTTPPVLILNNVIYQSGGRCIHNLETTNIWVVNNTCYSNSLDSRVAQTGSVGEYTNQKSKNVYMVNNVVHAWTKGYTFMNSPEASNIRYYNNISFGGRGATGLSSSITGDAKQIRNVDPQFLNAPRLDATADRQYANALNPLDITTHFYVKPTSPTINAGVDPTTLTTDPNLKKDLAQYVYKDIEGKVRPQGGGFDVGAYEYVEATRTPEPSSGGISGVQGSTITIYAASTPVKGVYASMDLYIDNKKAASWTNVRGDVANRKFVTYTHVHPTKLKTPSISIRFINDEVSGSEDRNLTVDKMVLDGVTYQTEADDTYSTGTYTRGEGCTEGRKSSETLNCEGYFRWY